MIERWKLRRELRRIGEQVATIPALFTEPFVQARYDRTRDAQIRLADGALPLQPKVAVFLVYQPAGLADSVLETCDCLHDCGYAVLLVANGFVDDAARARLLPHVWRVLERPNYGYDFGGYRDGIVKLDDWGIRPERLVILNDSIWLPVQAGGQPVLRAEARDDAITGLLMHTRASRDRLDRPEPQGMIESYFFSVPAAILVHPAFRRFWQKLRLSDVKSRVINRGERGFAKAMQAEGIAQCALSSRRLFLDAIATASPEFLRDTLRHAAYVDVRFQVRGDALLAAFEPTGAWRDRALAHVTETVYRRRFNASFYWAADRLGLTDFMKKNRGRLFARMRRAVLAAVDEGALPPQAPAFLAELRTMSAAESGSALAVTSVRPEPREPQ